MGDMIRVHRVKDWSVIAMEMLGWLAGYALMDAFLGQYMEFGYAVLWIVLLYAATGALQTLSQGPVLLTLGHAVLCVLILVQTRRTDRLIEEWTIFCLLLVVTRFLQGFCRWKQGAEEVCYSVKWQLLLLVFSIYGYGLYADSVLYRSLGCGFGILFVLLHFWCTYLQGLNDYLDEHAQLSNVPVESIFRQNTNMVLWLLGVLFVCLVGAEWLQFDQGFAWLGNLLVRGIRQVIAFFRYLSALVRHFNHPDTPVPELETPVGENWDSAGAQEDTPGFFWVISLVVFLGMLYLIVQFLKDVYKKTELQGERPQFGGYIRKDDVVEVYEENEEKRRFLLFRNNRQKVRYRFKKMVKRSFPEHVPQGDTARELGERICQSAENGKSEEEGGSKSENVRSRNRRRKEPETGNVSILTQLYDIARYSRREITEQDMKRLRRNGE